MKRLREHPAIYCHENIFTSVLHFLISCLSSRERKAKSTDTLVKLIISNLVHIAQHLYPYF